jgi:hypothetical protein
MTLALRIRIKLLYNILMDNESALRMGVYHIPNEDLPPELRWVDGTPDPTPAEMRQNIIDGGNCTTADSAIRPNTVIAALSEGPLDCPYSEQPCNFRLLTTDRYTGHCALLGPDATEPKVSPSDQTYVNLSQTEIAKGE